MLRMAAPLTVAMAAFALLAAVFLLMALVAVRRRRVIGTAMALLLGLLCLTLAALAGSVSLATLGYRALTREVVAATISTRVTGPQQFTATFTFADGRRRTFELTGDAIYVDALVVKWHSWANILGLHTAYQLDRVGGRYDRLEDEQTRPRRIYPLSAPNPVDMFQLARFLARFGPVVDAEYGSATFVSARQPAELELRVSTSGLLFRRREAAGGSR